MATGYEDRDQRLVGVFSTRLKAEEWISRHPQAAHYGAQPKFLISQRELDKIKDNESW